MLREVVQAQLLQEELLEELSLEQELLSEAEHASYFMLNFSSKEDADAALIKFKKAAF